MAFHCFRKMAKNKSKKSVVVNKPEASPQPIDFSSLTYDRVLGEGAFGIVLKSIDIHQKESAVKLIIPLWHGYGSQTSFTEYRQNNYHRLLRELKINNQIPPHENLVRVLNTGEKIYTPAELSQFYGGGYPFARSNQDPIPGCYIQMELCGKTLHDWLQQDHDLQDLRFQLKQVAIIKNIVSGLKHLHDNRIIHRDLHPKNILFSSLNNLPVKIGDFGFSRLIHSEHSETGPLTTRVGATPYRAPETETGDYTQQADLYSLGLVLLETVQLVREGVLRKQDFFEKLVYARNEDLVQDHPLMDNVKQLIIGLTKRRCQDRIGSIDLVQQIVSKWSGTPFYASNSEEFKSLLENVPARSTIILREGIYQGPFLMEKNNISIIGNHDNTVFKGESSTCLTIVGNGCTISGFKIDTESNQCGCCGVMLDGNKNLVEYVEFLCGDLCLKIHGDDNKLDKLQISKASSGITINGNNNFVEKTELNNISAVGISISDSSKGNKIVETAGYMVKLGVLMNGSNNSVINTQFFKDEGQIGYTAVELKSGSHHAVDNLTCSGYIQSSNDWGIIVNAEYCSIKDSTLVPVQVLGGNATLTNVDCGPVMKVEKSAKNVNISKCKGQTLESKLTMGIRNCSFQNFSKSAINYQSCLGDGGFGIVFKAKDSDGIPIAIKMLFPPPPPDQEMEMDTETETEGTRTESDEFIEMESIKHRRQMGRECQIPLGLEHRNLVKVIHTEETPFNYADARNMIDSLLPQEDLRQRRRLTLKCIEAEDRCCQEIYWIRMELCGETLWQWLRQKHNAHDVQIQIMQCQITLDLIEGVTYLHDRKLIHRDLKPKNIMFAKEGFTFPIKIGDFGLCRILHSEATQTAPITKRVGTRPYWAPEIREREEYSHRADLFSLGLVIWEVVQFICRATLEDWVYDWKPDLVDEHPLMTEVKDMIAELIKRRPEERPDNINHLIKYTKVWENILLERGGD